MNNNESIKPADLIQNTLNGPEYVVTAENAVAFFQQVTSFFGKQIADLQVRDEWGYLKIALTLVDKDNRWSVSSQSFPEGVTSYYPINAITF